MARRIISADSHMLIREQDFLAHLPEVHHDVWRQTLRWPPAAQDPPPANPAEALSAAGRPGEWDAAERLKDMDFDGVDAEVLYIDNLAGSRFYKLPPETSLAAFQAYNSAAVKFARRTRPAWCPSISCRWRMSRRRSIELHRLVDQGARAVQLPLYPTDARIPAYYDPQYERLWSAIEETGIPISLHICPPGGRA